MRKSKEQKPSWIIRWDRALALRDELLLKVNGNKRLNTRLFEQARDDLRWPLRSGKPVSSAKDTLLT